MKIKHICLALMSLFMANCAEEENVVSGEPKQEVRVTAGIGAQSRIALSDNGEHTITLWQSGDQISLFTDNQSNLVYSTSIENNSVVADFTAVHWRIQQGTVFMLLIPLLIGSQEEERL